MPNLRKRQSKRQWLWPAGAKPGEHHAGKSEKFVDEDIPLILSTLKKAHEGKKYARVTVDFNKDGGLFRPVGDQG